jgi:NTE family protein
MTRRALVLAGGGFASSAWEIGLIAGMAEAGIEVRNADLLVGTSSGSRVALFLASGVGLEELYERQVGPNPRPTDRPPAVDWMRLRGDLARAKEAGGGTTAILQRFGALALAMADSNLPDRRQAVAAQLPMQSWPAQKLLIAAINAETGERRAFDRDSGIDLVDAVIAATASFGWPPVLFEGHHYIDGGFYSTDNADLAAGCDRVVILALRSPVPRLSVVPIDATVETLRSGGAQVEVIHPDEDGQAVFDSLGSIMNPAVCAPMARAGREQGRRLVASNWW